MAASVRRDGLDDGARRRFLVAEADATRVGQRHRFPSAVMAWTTSQGADLWWPKPTPPAWGSVIVGADVAAAVRRDGVGDAGVRPERIPRREVAGATAFNAGTSQTQLDGNHADVIRHRLSVPFRAEITVGRSSGLSQ